MTETFDFRGYKVPSRLAAMTGSGAHNFAEISDWHQGLLKRWIGLKPTDNVVEIGCGIGRDAIPLAEYLTTGSYLGVDIIKASVDWCQQNVGRSNTNSRFVHFDVWDQLHNSTGTITTRDIRLPVADGSIDKVFLFSVFTHMLRDDIRHYLGEFRRIERPGGLIYATTFINDDAILDAARRTNLTPYDLRFEHEIAPGCRINSPDTPLGAVAYTRETWDDLVAQSGFVYGAHPQGGLVGLLRRTGRGSGRGDPYSSGLAVPPGPPKSELGDPGVSIVDGAIAARRAGSRER